MNTQLVTQFIFGHTAKLACVFVTIANECLQGFIKARCISFASDTTLPHRIAITRQRFANTLQPFSVLRHCLATLTSCGALFICPSRRDAGACLGRVFPSSTARRLALFGCAHLRSRFGRSFVGAALTQVCLIARRAPFNPASDRRTALDTRPLLCWIGIHWLNLPMFNYIIPQVTQ